jgi:fatty acid desaturase
MSLTLLKNMHLKHHKQNRTTVELFDYYGPTESKFLKYFVWYGILLGVFGFYPIIGTFLLALVPSSWILPLFKSTNSTKSYLENFSSHESFAIRIELLLIIGFYLALIYLLRIDAAIIALFLILSACNWSTRQFIEHAFTPLHVIEGGYNLQHNRWMSWILLHREWDLNHHRHPQVPWIYLPQLAGSEDRRFGYVAQYMRMWRGPLPAESATSYE